ncbi:MAG: GntR family transcriptional regulator [Victivallaceae bacterium]
MSDHHKNADLVRYLKIQLSTGVFPAGSRMPSVRQLMARFGLSYGVVRRTLKDFAAEKLLESVPNQGYFVKKIETGNKHKNRIGVITPVFPERYVAYPGLVLTALQSIEKYALSLGYALLEIPVVSGRELAGRSVELAALCDGLIVLKEIDLHLNEFPLELPASGILLNNDFGGKISVIEIDPFNAAYQAVRFFTARRRRKVVIFTSTLPVLWHRCKIFEYQWRHSGGEAELRVCDIDGFEAGYTFNREDGYFFAEDSHYELYARDYFNRFNRELYDFTSHLLSVDGKNLMIPDYRKIPTIAADWKQLGSTAFEEVAARINNPLRSARRIYLPGTLKGVSR